MEFDYVIVGAGTAGCVLANRLTADPAVTVALIEAGGSDASVKIRVPSFVPAAIADPQFGWGYKSAPQPHLNNRQIPLPRGKVFGGCSSINGMAYFRGHPRDFDDWVTDGAAGWGYEDVLPYFRKSENNETWSASRYHGSGGPMNVVDIPRPNPLIRRFLEATSSLGYKRCSDFNAADPEGFGTRQATIRGGRRESMATAYIGPIRNRPNLAIFTNALVTTLIIEDGRAKGAVIERAGTTERILAKREVIVSCGAYASPQVLMLSGIGDGEQLQKLGIEVRHHLPGVGAGLQDHPASVIQLKTADPTSYGVSVRAFPRGAWNVLEYLLWRKGPFASNVLEATGFVRTRLEKDRPDLQIVFMPLLRNPSGSPIPLGHGYGIIPIAVRPKSRGTVTLASPDPRAAPIIDPNYLDHPDDLRTLVDGVQIARRILAAPAFDSLQGVELVPGAAVNDEAGITQHVRNSAVSVHHPCSSCRMGVDELAVVDPQLRVRGLEGLRVIDASVFPRVVAGNTNAGVVMVAEKGADIVLGRASRPATESGAVSSFEMAG